MARVRPLSAFLAAVIATALLGFANIAHAAEPLGLGLPADFWSRSGGPDWASTRRTEGNSTAARQATFPINFSPNGTVPACIGWNTQTTITSSVAGACCLTMSTTVAMGAGNSANSLFIHDDFGADGNGACMEFMQRGERRSVLPIMPVLLDRPGSRTGVCSRPTHFQTSSGFPVYPPCRVDGDCIDAGSPSGTTCTTSPTLELRQESCAFVMCRTSESIDNAFSVGTEQ